MEESDVVAGIGKHLVKRCADELAAADEGDLGGV